MNFHVLTLFPKMIEAGLSESIIGRALKQGIISLETVNIRDFSNNRHNKVDDYTYGGGAGMLMQAEPVYQALRSVTDKINTDQKNCRVVYVTPQGSVFNQQMAAEFAKCDDLIFLCGHYEGIDERVLEETVTDYVSIGDYVLTGGEMPAMVMIDAISRFIPGVLHNVTSAETESFHGKLLEYPQYSRPAEWHNKKVPDVLMSGNQKEIELWRKNQSIERTRQRRPDLYKEYVCLDNCSRQLRKNKLHNIDMLELINRGNAGLHYSSGQVQILSDVASYTCYFSVTDGNGIADEEADNIIKMIEEAAQDKLVVHQRDYKSLFEGYGYKCIAAYKHAVYTKKEKLPARGLYRPDGRPDPRGLMLRQLTEADCQKALSLYEGADDREYIEKRIESGNMYGAFIPDDKDELDLIGIIGMHTDGSVGMLSVSTAYRRMKIASALETYLFNILIEKGYVPYCKIAEDNNSAIMLQEKLGLYFSKEPVFLMKKI